MAQIKYLERRVNYVKIHGLQRSGTNYLAYLVNENFKNTEILVNAGGWKHGCYCIRDIMGDDELHVLVIVKNPFAWLFSVYDYWKHNSLGPDLTDVSFEDFIKGRATFEYQSSVPFMIRAANAVQYWNNMNYHWASIRLKEKNVCVVAYERLLDDKKKTLDAISEKFGLDKKHKNYKNTNKQPTPSGEEVKMSDRKFEKKKFYLDCQYLNAYSPSLIEFVNKEVDPELMQIFGYEMVKKHGPEQNHQPSE
jgi:hypothetical protein